MKRTEFTDQQIAFALHQAAQNTSVGEIIHKKIPGNDKLFCSCMAEFMTPAGDRGPRYCLQLFSTGSGY
jgi:hypothetical protein